MLMNRRKGWVVLVQKLMLGPMEKLKLSLPGWDNLPGVVTQRSLQDALDRDRQSQLFTSSNLRDVARLNTLSGGRTTSAWLQAIPQPSLGLSLSKPEFIVALRYWLGIPLFDSTNPHTCACHSPLDRHGDHLLGCGHGPLRIRRHDALCNILFHALSQDNANVQREQRVSGESRDRPGDIFHPDFTDGRPSYFDVSVRNTLQPGNLNRASVNAGVAAAAGESEKDHRHAANVEQAGGVFYPVVTETLGIWTPSSLFLLRSIAARTTIRSGVPTKYAFRNLVQQLSVKLWSYNAKMMLQHLALLPRDNPLWDIPI